MAAATLGMWHLHFGLATALVAFYMEKDANHLSPMWRYQSIQGAVKNLISAWFVAAVEMSLHDPSCSRNAWAAAA